MFWLFITFILVFLAYKAGKDQGIRLQNSIWKVDSREEVNRG